MAKYEFDIHILPKDVDKRRTFTSRLDVALAINGCRITAGEYMVTIERKSAAQVRSEARSAQCLGCGRWDFDRPECKTNHNADGSDP